MRTIEYISRIRTDGFHQTAYYVNFISNRGSQCYNIILDVLSNIVTIQRFNLIFFAIQCINAFNHCAIGYFINIYFKTETLFVVHQSNSRVFLHRKELVSCQRRSRSESIRHILQVACRDMFETIILVATLSSDLSINQLDCVTIDSIYIFFACYFIECTRDSNICCFTVHQCISTACDFFLHYPLSIRKSLVAFHVSNDLIIKFCIVQDIRPTSLHCAVLFSHFSILYEINLLQVSSRENKCISINSRIAVL